MGRTADAPEAEWHPLSFDLSSTLEFVMAEPTARITVWEKKYLRSQLAGLGFLLCLVLIACGGPEDDSSSDSVSLDPAWSPDGSRIAYVTVWSPAGGFFPPQLSNSWSYVCVMDPNGRNKVVVESHVDDFDFEGFASPDWLPDGRLIYVRNGEVHGSTGWSGTWPSITGVSPAVSPDGNSVAFVSASVVHIINVDGSNEHVFAPGTEPAWSPDGSRLALTIGTGISIFDSDGAEIHRVAEKGNSPDWSPDGKRIIFDRYSSSLGSGIVVINVDGSREQYLTTREDTDPAWSPDGKKIAFVRDGSIFVMNSDGKSTKRLTGSGRCGED